MSRLIIIYGQPAAGKTYSLRNLDPASTVIFDCDTKHSLPWRGWKKNFNVNNTNFYSTDDLDWIVASIKRIGMADTKSSHIKTVVIDGFNTILTEMDVLNPDKSFNKWDQIATNVFQFIQTLKKQREDLTLILNAHVETSDPNIRNGVDKIKTPGKKLEKIGIESLVNYVFYAKAVDGEYFFETGPIQSSARSPEGCFPPKIPNDLAAAIAQIEKYEMGEE